MEILARIPTAQTSSSNIASPLQIAIGQKMPNTDAGALYRKHATHNAILCDMMALRQNGNRSSTWAHATISTLIGLADVSMLENVH